MPALPGEHYCGEHRGNHSYYAKENCILCRLQAQLEEHSRLLVEAGSIIAAGECGYKDCGLEESCPLCKKALEWSKQAEKAKAAAGEIKCTSAQTRSGSL